jgi:hypothetical protein
MVAYIALGAVWKEIDFYKPPLTSGWKEIDFYKPPLTSGHDSFPFSKIVISNRKTQTPMCLEKNPSSSTFRDSKLKANMWVELELSLRTATRRERHVVSHAHMEKDESSDCMLEAQIEGLDAAAAADDDDDLVQFNLRDIVGDAMRARLSEKYKLLHKLRRRASAGIVFKRIEEGSEGHYTLQRVESGADQLLRRASAGIVFKRNEEGSKGHYTLQRLESRADQASSSDDAEGAESQASSLPATKIEAGFFKSYAQRIKNQREMLSSKQTCGAPQKRLVPITVRPDCTVDQHIQTLQSAARFKWDDIVDVSLLHVKDTVNVEKNARKLSAKLESDY